MAHKPRGKKNIRHGRIPDKNLTKKNAIELKKRVGVSFTNKEKMSINKLKLINKYREFSRMTTGKKLNMSIVSGAERAFARNLEGQNVKFVTQVPIGKYTVDFLLPGKVIVEIEGRHHDSKGMKDANRTDFLEKLGYHVIRIPSRVAERVDYGKLIKNECVKRCEKRH